MFRLRVDAFRDPKHDKSSSLGSKISMWLSTTWTTFRKFSRFSLSLAGRTRTTTFTWLHTSFFAIVLHQYWTISANKDFGQLVSTNIAEKMCKILNIMQHRPMFCYAKFYRLRNYKALQCVKSCWLTQVKFRTCNHLNDTFFIAHWLFHDRLEH